MNLNKLFHNSFSAVSPLKTEDELLKHVIERTNNMENNKKIGFKKPIIAACAIFGALSLTTVAAAAAGIIDFNEIFGKTIITDDAQLGEKLIADATNVKWSTSDDDYVVNLKGVTGSEDKILAVIEIARADGTPVRDYLKNTDFEYESGFLSVYESVKINGGFNGGGASSGGCRSTLNADGNIEVEFRGSQDAMSGTTFELNSLGFYPTEELFDIPFEPMKEFAMLGESLEYTFTENEKAALKEIQLLDLSWSLEFTYTPSETGKSKIVMDSFSEPVDIFFDVMDGNDIVTSGAFDTTVEGLEMDSIGAKLDIMVEREDDSSYLLTLNPENNDIKVIYKDGTEAELKFSSWGGGGDTSYMRYSIYCTYNSNNAIVAADIAEISAIYINGETFKIK